MRIKCASLLLYWHAQGEPAVLEMRAQFATGVRDAWVCSCGVVFKCQASMLLWRTVVRFLLQHLPRLCLLRVKTWHLSSSGTPHRWRITWWTLTIATAQDPWYMDLCLIVSKMLCVLGVGWGWRYSVKSMLYCWAERGFRLHYGLRPFVCYSGAKLRLHNGRGLRLCHIATP